MRMSFSNLAWKSESDEEMYRKLQQYCFRGLEIAPTRLYPENPYSKLNEAKKWSQFIFEKYGLSISSMQSIWFGRNERLFGSKQEQQILLDYSKRAIDFASAIGCHNLVFGCPRNRCLPEGGMETVALDFFGEIAQYSLGNNTVFAIEANPSIYHTNYINTTSQAIDLVRKINSEGLKINLDVGTLLANNEDLSILDGNIELVNHVHISEPKLVAIREHQLHKELSVLLRREYYQGYISVEMSQQEDLSILDEICKYMKEIFE